MAMSIDVEGTLKIVTVDGPKVTIQGTYNPKELQIDEQVPWRQQEITKRAADLEYTGSQPRTLSVELLFDGFEQQASVVRQLDDLRALTQPFGTEIAEKRPPKVRVVWGKGEDSIDLPRFTGVVESVSIKCTMFSPQGQVLRATASIKVKEAELTATSKEVVAARQKGNRV